MKSYWKIVGIAAVTAAALYYPAMKLYKYMAKKRADAAGNEEEGEHVIKAFSPAYRGKHNPHHRRNVNNGHGNTGLA